MDLHSKILNFSFPPALWSTSLSLSVSVKIWALVAPAMYGFKGARKHKLDNLWCQHWFWFENESQLGLSSPVNQNTHDSRLLLYCVMQNRYVRTGKDLSTPYVYIVYCSIIYWYHDIWWYLVALSEFHILSTSHNFRNPAHTTCIAIFFTFLWLKHMTLQFIRESCTWCKISYINGIIEH